MPTPAAQRPLPSPGVVWGAAALLLIALGCGEPAAPRQPNVVIWLVDTLRADRLSCYGYERPTSPQIDALAADGVLFERMHVHSNWTQPSVSSLLTGRYPVDFDGGFVSTVPEDFVMAAEWFSLHGYATAGFTVSVAVAEEFGFAQGFDVYEELDAHLDGRARKKREGAAFDADTLVDRALGWLEDEWAGDKPFLLYLHSIDPHLPHEAHGGHQAWTEDYDGPLDGTTTNMFTALDEAWPLTEEDHRFITDLYDGEVAFNDAEFGRLQRALTEAGLAQDTLLIVLSDHGEEFWDRTMYGHGHDNLHGEMTHVPLVMAWPGGLPAGVRVESLARGIDLLPTVLEVVGLPPLPTTDGQSLAAQMLPEHGGGVVRPDPLFVVRGRKGTDPRAVRTERFFYSVHPRKQTRELYLLEDDPHTRADLSISRPDLADRAGRMLDDWVQEMQSRTQEIGERELLELDPETLERLRALGYVR